MAGSETAPLILLDSYSDGAFGNSWRFRDHVATLQAMAPTEVLPLLANLEQSAAAGLHAVGFIAYEAAAALNPDLPALPSIGGLPLAWFALYRERIKAGADTFPTGQGDRGADEAAQASIPCLEPDIGRENYLQNVEVIRDYIASGDSYQVNYTFGMGGEFKGDPLALYRTITTGQGAPFCAYLDTGRFTVISASPELFFSTREGTITTRPMKGTARRGRWLAEDAAQIAALKGSAKERAENLMIVDLLRNDLGMIARTGSVRVESLFDVETYPTLHQLTSTVSADLREGVGLAGILAALFPCGSVTGAPKRRSMEIIGELEGGPRGVYCGAIGYLAPGGEALFSVAIRTLLFDRENRQLRLGIGGGITTDSKGEEEYQECLTKASFLFRSDKEFKLLESLLLENGGYPSLLRHLERLRSSARFFGFKLDEAAVRAGLECHAGENSGLRKVRLVVAKNGDFTIASEALIPAPELLRLAVSERRVDSQDPFRYHKTTCRELLDAARAERPDVDEVLFLNERGELTEGSYHNLLLKLDGRLQTPRREAGLLAGVKRQELLEAGDADEATLYPADLAKAEELWLINSVRGVRRAELVEGGVF